MQWPPLCVNTEVSGGGLYLKAHAGQNPPPPPNPGRHPRADTPQQTATAADGTHPTVMHSYI